MYHIILEAVVQRCSVKKMFLELLEVALPLRQLKPICKRGTIKFFNVLFCKIHRKPPLPESIF